MLDSGQESSAPVAEETAAKSVESTGQDKKNSEDAARAAKKAAKEKHASSRAAEKAAKKAAKDQAKAAREAIKAQKKQESADRKQREKDEKAAKKRAKADQKAHEAKSLKSEIDAAAAEVRTCDENIKKYGRMSTADAETAGNRLIEIKPKLKLLRPKIGFQVWIETVCGIVYRTANNYMRVAEALIKDPALRELGLGDVYEILGLVTRKRKKTTSETDTGGNGGNSADADEDGNSDDLLDQDEPIDDDSGEDDDAHGGDEKASQSAARKPDATIGSLTARWFGGGYLIKLRGDWKKALHRAVDDEQFAAILHGPGVVLRIDDNGAGDEK